MATTINYELLKEVVSREEQIIREEIEVEDVGNFCIRTFDVKGVADYLAINTDESGFMTVIKIKSGNITWKHKDHYDVNLIITETQAFLRNKPTVMVITKKDFINMFNNTINEHCKLTMRKEDNEAEPVIAD